MQKYNVLNNFLFLRYEILVILSFCSSHNLNFSIYGNLTRREVECTEDSECPRPPFGTENADRLALNSIIDLGCKLITWPKPNWKIENALLFFSWPKPNWKIENALFWPKPNWKIENGILTYNVVCVDSPSAVPFERVLTIPVKDIPTGGTCHKGKCTICSRKSCNSRNQCQRGQCKLLPPGRCGSANDCQSGGTCFLSYCISGCRSDFECEGNSFCANRQCTKVEVSETSCKDNIPKGVKFDGILKCWDDWGLKENTTSGWNIVRQAWGKNELLREIVVDPIGGGNVVKIRYPKRSINPGIRIRGGSGIYAAPLDMRDSTLLMLEWQVFFEPGFNFQFGGKLPGLFGNTIENYSSGCSGGDKAYDCFATRKMWRENGDGELYLYVNKKYQSSLNCGTGCVPNPTYGYSIGRGNFRFPTVRWTKVREVTKLNTFTNGKFNADGALDLYFDDNDEPSISAKNIVFRDNENITPAGIDFATFFGGKEEKFRSPKLQYAYFKGFKLWAGNGNISTITGDIDEISNFEPCPLSATFSDIDKIDSRCTDRIIIKELASELHSTLLNYTNFLYLNSNYDQLFLQYRETMNQAFQNSFAAWMKANAATFFSCEVEIKICCCGRTGWCLDHHGFACNSGESCVPGNYLVLKDPCPYAPYAPPNGFETFGPENIKERIRPAVFKLKDPDGFYARLKEDTGMFKENIYFEESRDVWDGVIWKNIAHLKFDMPNPKELIEPKLQDHHNSVDYLYGCSFDPFNFDNCINAFAVPVYLLTDALDSMHSIVQQITKLNKKAAEERLKLAVIGFLSLFSLLLPGIGGALQAGAIAMLAIRTTAVLINLGLGIHGAVDTVNNNGTTLDYIFCILDMGLGAFEGFSMISTAARSSKLGKIVDMRAALNGAELGMLKPLSVAK
ncbi:hypothetical protein HDU92_008202, partial [Lobulomyces angularis]